MAQEYYAVDIPGKMLYDKQFSVSIRKITPLEQKYILSLSTKEQRTNKDFIDFIKKLVRIDNPEVHYSDGVLHVVFKKELKETKLEVL